jgi:hypothetical protein
MTKIWVSLIVASVVLSVMCINPHVAHAQSEALVAEIPFDFYVGTLKLPAGQYTVKAQADPALLRVYDGNGHVSLTYSNGVHRPGGTLRSEMLFNRYGDQYFLSEVRWTGYSVARQLLKSPFETEIAKDSAPPRVIAVRNTK